MYFKQNALSSVRSTVHRRKLPVKGRGSLLKKPTNMMIEFSAPTYGIRLDYSLQLGEIFLILSESKAFVVGRSKVFLHWCYGRFFSHVYDSN